ncbi:hypothetical protein P4H61_13895 [Paenibacillus peoriae]|uniref:hypothetical protein n=1 Tax=Paenibacillus peoriae TaxID=59893 RepID=UPI00026C666F|nr:hypothetical protein [Paenibacillus peoriae]MEC0182576.1 hypothetical protein [Paenibacillus peoriae]
MKKKGSLLLVSIIMLAAISPVSAESNTVEESGNQIGIIDIQNPSKDTIVSDVLTFSEMAKQISNDYGISINEASDLLRSQSKASAISKSDFEATATYRTLSSFLHEMPNGYTPYMRFYCETTEGGSFRGITKIISHNLVRAYNGISKQFSGTVESHLEHANKIHYIVNGDFYNNGTTTITGGGSIGLGGVGSLNFSVSSSSNHFRYYYGEHDLIF